MKYAFPMPAAARLKAGGLKYDHGRSLRSIQRFVCEAHSPPPRRAGPRIETPPGDDAQAACATYPRVVVGPRR